MPDILTDDERQAYAALAKAAARVQELQSGKKRFRKGDLKSPDLSKDGLELAIGGAILQQGDLPTLGWGDFAFFLKRLKAVADLDAAFARGDSFLVFKNGRLVSDSLLSAERRDAALAGALDTLSVDVRGLVGHLRARLAEAGEGRR